MKKQSYYTTYTSTQVLHKIWFWCRVIGGCMFFGAMIGFIILVGAIIEGRL